MRHIHCTNFFPFGGVGLSVARVIVYHRDKNVIPSSTRNSHYLYVAGEIFCVHRAVIAATTFSFDFGICDATGDTTLVC